jgi:hypothetical protein|tara:strand:+ start:4488 stop:5099 length:612 start_codon:yes stop_codon:yes gene_type:complete
VSVIDSTSCGDRYIIYLHGFLSSPQSKKAQQTVDYCNQFGIGDRIYVPELGTGPARTIAEIRRLIESRDEDEVVLIGSSLGGFYATCVAEEFNLKAALVNPAVRPHQFWETHLGEHRNYYSGKIHRVTEEHINELKTIDSADLQYPQNFLLLLQKGDETLDYRQAAEKYQSSTCIIQENGNHSFENFDRVLPSIFKFLLARSD